MKDKIKEKLTKRLLEYEEHELVKTYFRGRLAQHEETKKAERERLKKIIRKCDFLSKYAQKELIKKLEEKEKKNISAWDIAFNKNNKDYNKTCKELDNFELEEKEDDCNKGKEKGDDIRVCGYKILEEKEE